MSNDTSSRSTCVPISRVNVVSKAVEWVVNGGALLPKELTTRTRGGWAVSAAWARVARPSSNGTHSVVWKRRKDDRIQFSTGRSFHEHFIGG